MVYQFQAFCYSNTNHHDLGTYTGPEALRFSVGICWLNEWANTAMLSQANALRKQTPSCPAAVIPPLFCFCLLFCIFSHLAAWLRIQTTRSCSAGANSVPLPVEAQTTHVAESREGVCRAGGLPSVQMLSGWFCHHLDSPAS